MGFFKKKKEDLDLDLPPPPKPSFGIIKSHEKAKELKLDLPPLEKKEVKDEFPHVHDIKDLEKDLPPLPDLEDLEKELPPLRKMGKEELPKLNYPKIEHEEEPKQISAGPIEKLELTQDEKPMLKGPVFVSIGSYKTALSDLVLIRSKIKESETSLKRLNEIKNSKDKYFEQFRSKLEDLQRKSAYDQGESLKRG